MVCAAAAADSAAASSSSVTISIARATTTTRARNYWRSKNASKLSSSMVQVVLVSSSLLLFGFLLLLVLMQFWSSQSVLTAYQNLLLLPTINSPTTTSKIDEHPVAGFLSSSQVSSLSSSSISSHDENIKDFDQNNHLSIVEWLRRASNPNRMDRRTREQQRKQQKELVRLILGCQSQEECSQQLVRVFQQDDTMVVTTSGASSPDAETAQQQNDLSFTKLHKHSKNNYNPCVQRRGILLSSQCSGSEWLALSLNSTPGIMWTTEPLAQYSLKLSLWNNSTWDNYQRDLESAFPIVSSSCGPSSLSQQPKQQQRIMTGFKLMYDQIPQRFYQQFASWVSDHNITILHLRRRCAALQYASQIEKYQRWRLLQAQRTGKDINHFTQSTDFAALPIVHKLHLKDPKWQQLVRSLEDNQKVFGRYVRVHMARAPVMEVAYEDLDGPHGRHWLRAILAFLGQPVEAAPAKAVETATDWSRINSLSQDSAKQQSNSILVNNNPVVKTGSRLCDERMTGLGRPTYSSLALTESRIECMRLRELYRPDWRSNLSIYELGLEGTPPRENMTNFLQNVFKSSFPPMSGRCRWTPACTQGAYARQYELFKQRLDHQ